MVCIQIKNKKNLHILLKFLKSKGYKWESGTCLTNKKILDRYWDTNKSKMFIVTNNFTNKTVQTFSPSVYLTKTVQFGNIDKDIHNKNTIKELNTNNKLLKPFNIDKLEKLLLTENLTK